METYRLNGCNIQVAFNEDGTLWLNYDIPAALGIKHIGRPAEGMIEAIDALRVSNSCEGEPLRINFKEWLNELSAKPPEIT